MSSGGVADMAFSVLCGFSLLQQFAVHTATILSVQSDVRRSQARIDQPGMNSIGHISNSKETLVEEKIFETIVTIRIKNPLQLPKIEPISQT